MRIKDLCALNNYWNRRWNLCARTDLVSGRVVEIYRALRFWTNSPNIGNILKVSKKNAPDPSFGPRACRPRGPHIVLWVFKIMVDLASDSMPRRWRGVGFCWVGHLRAILNTFTTGPYAPQSSFRDKAVSPPFLFLCSYNTTFIVSP